MSSSQHTSKPDDLDSTSNANNVDPANTMIPHKTTCPVCVPRGVEGGHHVQLNCGCIRCDRCINTEWSHTLCTVRDVRRLPVCDCNKPLPIDECRPWIEPSTRRQFDNHIKELETSPAEQVFCAQNDCYDYISPDNINKKYNIATCVLCNKDTCLECGRPTRYHTPAYSFNCDGHIESFEEMAERKGWVKCPGDDCGIWCSPGWRGCMHAECPICDTEFCFRCGVATMDRAEAWEDYALLQEHMDEDEIPHRFCECPLDGLWDNINFEGAC